jgi:hypothetical protein
LTYRQLAEALLLLEAWEQELAEISGHNYDPHGHDLERRKEIDRLMDQEIPE